MRKVALKKHREQLPTMLIVGEEFAEVALLKHLRALYVPRDAGLALTIDNARGKGAAHVMSTAARKARMFAYDFVWVLLDTDQDYDERLVSEAKRKKIHIAACEPCLEAVLLRIKGVNPVGRSPAIKRQFENRYGSAAHQPDVYRAHYDLSVLEHNLCTTSSIGHLIQAMTSACLKKL